VSEADPIYAKKGKNYDIRKHLLLLTLHMFLTDFSYFKRWFLGTGKHDTFVWSRKRLAFSWRFFV